MSKKVDITGLMVKAKKGWEKRGARLAKPEYFQISIGIDPALRTQTGLTQDEQKRLRIKLELVREAASYMAAGMVKGTIKYEHDNYDVKTWMAHVIGEGADQYNYEILLANAFAKNQEK